MRRSTLKVFGYGLVALSCGAIACAASGGGDGGNNPNGNNTGGLISGDGGGTGQLPPGSGGTTPPGGGEQPPPGSGGTTPGSGGSGSGPVEVVCPDSPFFNKGYVSTGQLCGYGYTAAWDDATATPPCGGGECFEMADTFCATGSIPAKDEVAMKYPGISLGFNVHQNSSGQEGPGVAASGTGLTFDVTASGNASNLRVVVTSGATDYCYTTSVTTGTFTVNWSDLKVQCYNPTPGAALSPGATINKVGVQVTEADTAQTVSLCINNVTHN